MYWGVLGPHCDSISIDSPEDFERTIKPVPLHIVLLYAAHFCQSEVCNGGFSQFFSNSTGVLAPEAVEAFKAIGQPGVADSVQQAMSVLGLPYERSRRDRWHALDRVIEQYGGTVSEPFPGVLFRKADSFRPIEHQFYELIRKEGGGFEAAADRYADSKGTLR